MALSAGLAVALATGLPYDACDTIATVRYGPTLGKAWMRAHLSSTTSTSAVRGALIEQTDGVATWAQFETEAPELAEVVERLWPSIVALNRDIPAPAGAPCFAISYLASVRRDGGPRLHPV